MLQSSKFLGALPAKRAEGAPVEDPVGSRLVDHPVVGTIVLGYLLIALADCRVTAGISLVHRLAASFAAALRMVTSRKLTSVV